MDTRTRTEQTCAPGNAERIPTVEEALAILSLVNEQLMRSLQSDMLPLLSMIVSEVRSLIEHK